MTYTVKRVSQLAGVSIRTLHHYDEIGLLKPAQVSAAGYRQYTEGDLERLQQVLFYRELGIALHEIKGILEDPGFDRRQALLQHKRSLVQRHEQIGRLIQSVDRTLEAMERGIRVDEKELFAGFDNSQYEEEARQRWGHTEAYKESQRRAKRYTKEDWAQIQAEMQAIEQGLAALIDRDPADPEVQQWVERHHRQINDRFYNCSTEIYRGLAEMYVADARFTAHYDQIRPGLAQFVRAAMNVYCDKLEGKR